MKLLATVFFGMALWGFLFGKAGAGLIALAFGVMTLFAIRKFKQQDKQWRDDPGHAATEPCTTQMLDEHCCECTGDKL